MVFNATLSNILVLLMEETGVPGENHWSVAIHWQNFITYCWIKYTSPWVGFELTSFVVIVADCINSCKSNYHTIKTKTALESNWQLKWWYFVIDTEIVRDFILISLTCAFIQNVLQSTLSHANKTAKESIEQWVNISLKYIW